MECGECTLCCKLLRIEETNSLPNEICKYCKENIGCKIYDNRPESCKIFECAWKQMKYADLDLRPDKCNALFEKWSDNIMVGVTDKCISTLIHKQIDFFRGEGISVLFLDHYTKSKVYFLAENHTKDFIKGDINDSPKLYNRFS